MDTATGELVALIAPVILFAFTMTATPGPNNMMLTASGANFGFRKTLPHIVGVMLGCVGLMTAVALGLGHIFTTWPILQSVLKVVGSAYLLWLAWKIATAAPPSAKSASEAKPLSVMQAAAFQFANPKAWIMAISGVASFTLAGDGYLLSAALLIGLMALVTIPAISMWAGFGVAVGRMLKTARHWRVFNLSMGGLTAACVVLILV
ncbi:Threonine/homoserine/homoserine lactone efflux protein [Marinobacterium sediminicola]|uniref:Threonine/homoserine/homoserine lactone efflux protein n=2 Tax=Marinobacterium sediminicola TaxID=518898 RepID=A0ABY1RXD5_9GAMM|nr:LysE family translocator [Marinobacterium sediminicola]ULG70824.1 LysE family translocator [Marinobacterium sediminicola]SMR71591.1 Threonine/homoserine/homoserine lactone efflux protein [Marinobacterium sediminicola]